MKILKLSFLIFLLSAYTATMAQQDRKPNVLFILVDDLGWKDLGCYGSSFYETPNIDALADRGVRFTDAYAASPVCSPSRAAIMTGKHPVTVDITDWIPGMPDAYAEHPKLKTPADMHDMPLEEETLAEAFKAVGYRTFFAGKWHLGESETFWPENQGFDINKGGHHKGSPPGGYYAPYENPKLSDGPEGEYLTDRLTDESMDFIKAANGTPFFLMLSFYTVHTPIQGCDAYNDHFLNKKHQLPDSGSVKWRREQNGKTRLNQSNHKYAAMVRSMDENVGRLLDLLDTLKLMENTIIVFTSDNGGLTTRANPGPTAELPLRAGKGWCYEGGIRVPLIIKAPGLKKGKLSRQPVTGMDYYPTLLELAGIPLKHSQHVDGESIVRILNKPKKVEDKTLVWHYPHYHGSTWRPGSAIRKGRWKLIEFYESGEVELYNLKKDIEEQNDLADRHPEIVREMKSEMHQYIKTRGGKYPVAQK